MSAVAPKATRLGRARFKTSFLAEAERRGLVGAIAGPTDLATNRKRYLKRAVRGRTRSAAR